MQVYDTLRAGAIQDVRVGRSVVTPTTPVQSAPNPNTLKAKRAETAHIQKLNDIGADATLNAEQKRAAVAAENESYAANVPTKDFHPDYAAEHHDRLAAIAATSLTNAQKKTATDAENADYADDENQDGTPDETQDIIHITLAGGEKRSILRSDLLFSPIVAERPVDGFPVYAQKRPVINAGIKPLEEIQPSQPVLASDTVHDQGAAQPVPVVGDYLVEDFDPLTDRFVQKIYDAVTFNRYFKASLN